ncbi:hypothetical protein 20Sep418_00140 [Pseudomonas phage 20Sep418]|uniref:Uncharacterized protein n=3 Tax=Pakpunavirus TaxID=1921407 RepID=A0A9E6QAM6_9CAUD|nr:hypothetical protein QE325_gp101 [Pseudomonas phage pPA-3099-2aT.2]YP_010763218.1 hypothetical protein QE329_gp058 [Pseudomonas phage PhL_UNISO_PA-DSM_ph0034]YP_010765588.1 hypothetical protein QE349_gp095 [Pseudomonas phage vB_Paer_PsCh]WFG37299.1 hypothetical protein 9081_00198 [Pseudomonas phage bmx-p3]WFG37815.1 hypothetical protein 20Sep418_00140 [Pseudomonas phage 20Sep418]QYC95178.1 hypothetical protein [Pseudomonas phage PhL_UNISO_PA-DSM_ph0034]UOL47926.1 hypothetical protein vBPae
MARTPHFSPPTRRASFCLKFAVDKVGRNM